MFKEHPFDTLGHNATALSKDPLALELPMYQKWHAILPAVLTQQDKLFERNILGISLSDAEKIHDVTGCVSLQDYVMRMALNDEAFSELLAKCFGSTRNQKAFTFISQMRLMVRDLTLLHRVSFLMR